VEAAVASKALGDCSPATSDDRRLATTANWT
jgi:hypothetical protein